ncbi:hypothetical protein P879_11749, partial [Paragonimus westermani]
FAIFSRILIYGFLKYDCQSYSEIFPVSSSNAAYKTPINGRKPVKRNLTEKLTSCFKGMTEIIAILKKNLIRRQIHRNSAFWITKKTQVPLYHKAMYPLTPDLRADLITPVE